jgi:hypothetical protein
MNRLIKAIVPRPILNTAVETKDWLRLLTLRQQAFDSGNLRNADTLQGPISLAENRVPAASLR